jgi:thymidine kinase
MFVLHSPSGWVEVIAGPMFSGKTDELARRVRLALRAGRRVALFTSRLDATHPAPWGVTLEHGERLESVSVATADELLRAVPPETELLAIDEIQFFDPGLRVALDRLASAGVEVVCAGLDTDYRGATFGVMGDVLAHAEAITKAYGTCARCGGSSTRTQRLVSGRPAAADSPVVATDETVVYESRCRSCHMVPEEQHDEA